MNENANELKKGIETFGCWTIILIIFVMGMTVILALKSDLIREAVEHLEARELARRYPSPVCDRCGRIENCQGICENEGEGE